MSDTPPAGPATPAADTLGGLDPGKLLEQAVDPAAPTAPLAAPRWQAPTPEALTALLPQLQVLELIGQGGMGAVYRAVQRHLDRPVALKVLPRELGADPDFAARFAREARALARLNHPNLVTVHDYGQNDGWCWLVMELVDGANLRQVMRTGRLSPQQALAIVPQLCDALQYAHDEGVVHRDIKPENILLDARGRVKIADFGLAKLRGAPAGEVLTASGAVLGTVHYMAPEQVEGAKDVDHRADIYALGVVFYEMLTGGLPLGRFDPPSRRVAVDVRLDEVVLKALEKDPARRYQQAAEVQSAVAGAQAGQAPPTGRAAAGERLRVGPVEIGDHGIRIGDRVVIDGQGVRLGGEGKGEEDALRNHHARQAITLLAGGLLAGLAAVRELHGSDLLAMPWLAAGSLCAAPLMLWGGTCLQLRALPAWAGLGCYAALLPALWCWQHSWWLGIIGLLVFLWLASAVGGRRWDRHFSQPVPRLHALLLALLALVIAAGSLVGFSQVRRSPAPPATTLNAVDARRFSYALGGQDATCVGPGTHEYTGISGLPTTRRFTARPFVGWHGVEGEAEIRMKVDFGDRDTLVVARRLAAGAVGPGATPVASAGRHAVPLSCDVGDGLVTGIRLEVMLPGRGTVVLNQPVLIEDDAVEAPR